MELSVLKKAVSKLTEEESCLYAVQRWLREEKGYYVYPFFDNEELKWTYVVREKTGDMWIPLIGETSYYDSFDESMEDALKYALENLVI